MLVRKMFQGELGFFWMKAVRRKTCLLQKNTKPRPLHGRFKFVQCVILSPLYW